MVQAGEFSSQHECTFTSPKSGKTIKVGSPLTGAVGLPCACLRPYHPLSCKPLDPTSAQQAAPGV